MTPTWRLRPLAAFLLSAPALATTWIVDDDGGPGVDFTDLPPAVAAAQVGDTIVVLAGVYSGFTLSTRGVTIVGPGLGGPSASRARCTSEVRVESLPAGRRVVLSGLRLVDLTVCACASPVIVDECEAFLAAWRVENSDDVRLTRVDLRGAAPHPALEVVASRLEVTRSEILGGSGQTGPTFHGEPGGIAIASSQGADLHLSSSRVLGGSGGDGICDTGQGGDGNYAILASGPGTRVLVTGVAVDLIHGGCGGFGCFDVGLYRPALHVEQSAFARVSGASFGACSFGAITTATGGVVEDAAPVDPSLVATGSQAPGGMLTLVVRGPVGASARLRLGRAPDVVPVAESYEDRLLDPLRTFSLGALPPSGEATFTIGLDSGLPLGTLIMAQGSTTTASGTELTQSTPLVLR